MKNRMTHLSVATMLALSAVLAACSSASDGPGESTESIGDDTSSIATTGKWVSGYYVGYQQSIYPPTAIDFTGLTHLIVGRIVPNANGTLNTSLDTGNGPALAKQLSQLTHAAGKKAILMVGGAGTHDAWVSASSAGTRATFVANLIQTMNDLGYDGLDLDWEPLNPADFASFKALATALRQAKPTMLLTVPVAWSDPVDAFYGQIAPLFDQINIMSYSMADAWPGWQSWHGSAIYGQTSTTPSSIDRYTTAYLNSGVPAAKLGIGIGFYGSCWSAPVTGPRQTLGSSHVVASDNTMSYTNIMAGYYNAANYQFDSTAKAPYLSFSKATGNQGCTFVSYENEASILEKGKYAQTKGLGGAIIWTINQGYLPNAPAGQRNPLLQAAKTGFLGGTATPTPTPTTTATTPPPTTPPTTTPTPDTSKYGFESGNQGWSTTGNVTASSAVSQDRAFAGSKSLALTVNATGAGNTDVHVAAPSAPAGATVTFNVWVPAGALTGLSGLQPFGMQGAAGNWGWTSSWYAASQLKAGAWNTLTLKLPANAVVPLAQLGLEVFTTGAYSGTFYVDAVNY